MKRGIKSLLVLTVFILLFGMLFVGGVSAACSDNQRIMRLYQTSNSHGAVFDDTNGYNIEICYSEIFETDYTGDLATVHNCSAETIPDNKVLGLSDISNAHAEIPSLNNYAVDVCYGNLECESIISGSCSDLGTEYKTVVSLYDTTNSHISAGDFADYDIKICCKQGEVIPIGNVYWADMQGNPITDAEIGDSVLMIYQDMAGQSYDFEVFEKDEYSNDYIRTITESFDFGADLVAKWVITQEDWEKDLFSEPEFIFKVNEIESGNLNVLEDSFANSPALTQIIKPVAETNYVIGQGEVTTNAISFEQISSDLDDDLEITWNFGDGESASFENCLSGVNCNTTHQYTSSGTKNIILSASEMAPRTLIQTVKDYSRIYVYNKGTTAFVITDQTINGRIVIIDATKTHVSECYYDQAVCGGNCYQITDEINSNDFVWCRYLTLKVDGIDSDPNFFLNWTLDGVAFTPTQMGNEMKYIKIFDEPGDHIINLNVQYKL